MSQPSEREKQTFVQLVDQSSQAALEFGVSRVSLYLSHDIGEGPLPYLLDYIESTGAKVEHVSTSIEQKGTFKVVHSIVYKLKEVVPWDGTVQIEGQFYAGDEE